MYLQLLLSNMVPCVSCWILELERLFYWMFTCVFDWISQLSTNGTNASRTKGLLMEREQVQPRCWSAESLSRPSIEARQGQNLWEPISSALSLSVPAVLSLYLAESFFWRVRVFDVRFSLSLIWTYLNLLVSTWLISPVCVCCSCFMCNFLKSHINFRL